MLKTPPLHVPYAACSQRRGLVLIAGCEASLFLFITSGHEACSLWLEERALNNTEPTRPNPAVPQRFPGHFEKRLSTTARPSDDYVINHGGNPLGWIVAFLGAPTPTNVKVFCWLISAATHWTMGHGMRVAGFRSGVIL